MVALLFFLLYQLLQQHKDQVSFASSIASDTSILSEGIAEKSFEQHVDLDAQLISTYEESIAKLKDNVHNAEASQVRLLACLFLFCRNH